MFTMVNLKGFIELVSFLLDESWTKATACQYVYLALSAMYRTCSYSYGTENVRIKSMVNILAYMMKTCLVTDLH